MESEIFYEDIQNILDDPKSLNLLQESIEEAFEKIHLRYLELYSSPEYLAAFLMFHFVESIKTSLEWHEITAHDIDSEEDFLEDEEDFEEDEEYF